MRTRFLSAFAISILIVFAATSGCSEDVGKEDDGSGLTTQDLARSLEAGQPHPLLVDAASALAEELDQTELTYLNEVDWRSSSAEAIIDDPVMQFAGESAENALAAYELDTGSTRQQMLCESSSGGCEALLESTDTALRALFEGSCSVMVAGADDVEVSGCALVLTAVIAKKPADTVLTPGLYTDQSKWEEVATNSGAPGMVQADRPTISFAATEIGATSTERIRISNAGQGTLRISEIRLVEETDEDQGGVEFQQGQDWQTNARLAPGEFIDLEIRYRPLDTSPDRGSLIIESDDPMLPVLTIPVDTAALSPMIYSESPIEFGTVPPVTNETRDTYWEITTVENRGQAPLAINDITVIGDDFKVTFPTSSDPNADPSTDTDVWPDTVQPGSSFPVRVYFNPIDDLPASADLIFFTNDPENSQYTVELFGNR